MLAFMHTCVCFCTLALTFPLFQCLSVALSAPNTASLLSTASLSDSRFHQEWPFPPTSLFFSLPLSFYFFRSEVVVSSVVQSRSVGRVQAVALLSQEHCFLFTLHLDYAAILRRTFSSTKCVYSMKRGFYVALVTFIELIFFTDVWVPGLTAEPFKLSLCCDHRCGSCSNTRTRSGHTAADFSSFKRARKQRGLCDCAYDNHPYVCSLFLWVLMSCLAQD